MGSPATRFDIVFLGGGVSTIYTILNLRKRLVEGARPLRLAIVERAAGLGGLPYDGRSGYTSLLITSLRNFLPDAERALFVEWLNANGRRALERYRAQGGEVASAWLAAHQDAMEAGEWEDLYLPRYLFGVYMEERLRGVAPSCPVEVVHGEVTGVSKTADIFRVDLASGVALEADSVVLAVGSPPNEARLLGPSESAGACLVEDPYEPSLQHWLERMETQLRQGGDAEPEVVFLGASASTLDVLYSLQDRWLRAWPTVRFTVLAPNGKLPDCLTERPVALHFKPSTLDELTGRDGVEAREIYDAAVRDIELGEGAGLTTPDMLGPISAAVDVLVKRLPVEGKREFATRWGTAIGRLQRRAGPEYSALAADLAAQGRLQVVQGRFRRIASITAEGAEVEYERQGAVERLPSRARIVLNCAGFATLKQLQQGHLLQGMLNSGLVRPTASFAGIAVDDCMEASPGLFVLGPLLAGNVIRGMAVWHLEHCGRISNFSDALAEVLTDRLSLYRPRPANKGPSRRYNTG